MLLVLWRACRFWVLVLGVGFGCWFWVLVLGVGCWLGVLRVVWGFATNNGGLCCFTAGKAKACVGS